MLFKNKDSKEFVNVIFWTIIAFASGGAGLSILFYSKGDLISTIVGFVLMGFALAVLAKKVITGA